MMDDIKRAILGDHEAAKRLTDAGMLIPCPFCGNDAVVHEVYGDTTVGAASGGNIYGH